MKETPLLNPKTDASSATAESTVSDTIIMTEDEKRRMRRAALIKIAAMVLFIIIVLVFNSIAWLIVNKNVSNAGMGVQVADYPLVIEVRGSNAENKSLFTKANEALFGSGGAAYQEGEQPDDTLQYFQATASKDKIIWEKTGNTAADGHYADGLEPDACGKLTFWVVAKEAGTFDPEFQFQIKGFHAVTHDVKEGANTITIVDNLFEINEDLSDHSNVDATLTTALEAEKIQALGYIRGHILFFKSQDSDGYYSGFLGADRSFRLSDYYPDEGGTTFTKGQKKEITVYWKWANTLEQMIYDSSQSNYSPILKDSTSADRTALYTYFLPTNSSMFYELTDAEVSGYVADLQGNDETKKSIARSKLSAAYNDADQEIGDMVNYILIEMTTAH